MMLPSMPSRPRDFLTVSICQFLTRVRVSLETELKSCRASDVPAFTLSNRKPYSSWSATSMESRGVRGLRKACPPGTRSSIAVNMISSSFICD